MTTSLPLPDRGEILAALDALFPADAVVELRAFPKGPKRTTAGYFDGEHRDELADHAVRLNAAGAAVFVTMNPIDPQLLGRYCNRVADYAKETTTDANVTARRWLLLDFDPVRPAGTSAKEAQLVAAREVTTACRDELAWRGWPSPIVAESGNGLHLLYPVDLPNDTESRDLVKGALAGLAKRFDTPAIKLDQSVFNAGRVTKLYGTVANKGDATAMTPWRPSRLVSVPSRGVVVSAERLREWNPLPGIEAQRTHSPGAAVAGTWSAFDLDVFLGRLGIPFERDMHEGADRFKLSHCPFNPDHGKGEAAIFRRADGQLGFKCQHNSCADFHWRDVRALVDPHSRAERVGVVDATARQPIQAPALAAGTRDRTSLILLQGADIRPEPVRWLWDGWLAAGKLHILAGAPGTGKTTIAMALAATVSLGGRWPDGTRSEAGGVVIASYEDDPADTIAPRLLAAGADMARVTLLDGVFEGTERRAFSARDDGALLAGEIRRIGVRLLIMDPIISALGSFDSHKNAETRQALQPLADLAAETGVAILGIAHFTKGTAGRDPLERVSGSLAFGAVARVVMGAATNRDVDGEEQRLFVRVKSNIGPDSGGFTYALEQTQAAPEVFASRVLWGDAVEGSARELLAEPDGGEDGDSPQAMERFIRSLLANGPILASEFRKDADGAGYHWRAIYRLAKKLGAEPKKESMRGPWRWGFYDSPKMTSPHEGDEGDTTRSLSSSSSSAGSVTPSWVPGPAVVTADDTEVV